MATARDLIKASMRLATILASGESPTADELNDGLKVLNDMLEGWSTERLSVWSRDTQLFAASAGVASYTIGPAGTWNTTRPVHVSPSFARLNGSDFPIDVWGQAEYDLQAVKTIGGIPERLVYINDFPLGTITLFPVPSQAMTIGLNVDRVLTFPLALTDVLSYPPGYERALRYTLAVNLAPEFGVIPPPDVAGIARAAKADVKRANKTRVLSSFDPALRGPAGGYSYWRSGGL